MKRVLKFIEGTLYVLFALDCAALIVGTTQTPVGASEPGGLSLIVLLLLAYGVRRLRCGRDPYRDY